MVPGTHGVHTEIVFANPPWHEGKKNIKCSLFQLLQEEANLLGTLKNNIIVEREGWGHVIAMLAGLGISLSLKYRNTKNLNPCAFTAFGAGCYKHFW